MIPREFKKLLEKYDNGYEQSVGAVIWRTGWLTERLMWRRAAKQLDTVRDTWVVIDMSLSI